MHMVEEIVKFRAPARKHICQLARAQPEVLPRCQATDPKNNTILSISRWHSVFLIHGWWLQHLEKLMEQWGGRFT